MDQNLYGQIGISVRTLIQDKISISGSNKLIKKSEQAIVLKKGMQISLIKNN